LVRRNVRAALTEDGSSSDDIKEILLQHAVHYGVPAANHAFKEAGEIVREVAKT
jgi:alkylhydroperoxidase/carboxymuconolactone decarboxylase family protein YurZ